MNTCLRFWKENGRPDLRVLDSTLFYSTRHTLLKSCFAAFTEPPMLMSRAELLLSRPTFQTYPCPLPPPALFLLPSVLGALLATGETSTVKARSLPRGAPIWKDLTQWARMTLNRINPLFSGTAKRQFWKLNEQSALGWGAEGGLNLRGHLPHHTKGHKPLDHNLGLMSSFRLR